jgi:Transglutaminase-like superfamily
MPRRADDRLRLWPKVRLAVRVWRFYIRVRLGLRRSPLPAFVQELASIPVRGGRHPPALLSLAVHRSLQLGPLRPRCLTNSLVLFGLLREQGDEAEVVIGLPEQARGHTAHAWVELEHRDVGPPPGRGRHTAMARYP